MHFTLGNEVTSALSRISNPNSMIVEEDLNVTTTEEISSKQACEQSLNELKKIYTKAERKECSNS